jgi:hypothetical protein
MSRGKGRGRGGADPLAAWRRRVAAVRAEAERVLGARELLGLVSGVVLDSGQGGEGPVVLRVQLRGRAPLVFVQRAAGEPVTLAERAEQGAELAEQGAEQGAERAEEGGPR